VAFQVVVVPVVRFKDYSPCPYVVRDSKGGKEQTDPKAWEAKS